MKIRDRITCADGFSVSVQASDFHYSTPQKNSGPVGVNNWLLE